jgi:hypothetical protein
MCCSLVIHTVIFITNWRVFTRKSPQYTTARCLNHGTMLLLAALPCSYFRQRSYLHVCQSQWPLVLPQIYVIFQRRFVLTEFSQIACVYPLWAQVIHESFCVNSFEQFYILKTRSAQGFGSTPHKISASTT